ncbi:MAG: flagellar hook-associated protein FlgK [Caulobacteraceae bacterium]|nr:flagellar hook-associated protein FlgK [Caulobacteraceae bacterium]
MSLTSIQMTAGSALLTTQYQISVTTDNVSNASTTGATQKTYTPTSSASLTSALSTGEVTRLADAYLSKTVNSSAAADGASSTINSYLQSYDAALGSTSNSDDISSLLTSFQTAISTLSSSPTSSSDKAAVVSAASTLADSLSSLSSTIQSLRTQASSDIGTTVSSINTDLQTLQTLNQQIAAANNAGTDATSLEDQRDTTLTDLSSKIGVNYYTDSNNQLVVYDQGGDQLLGSQAATLTYSSTGTLSASTSYPGAISGITVNGTDITSSVTSGTLGGLIQLRDDILPGQQDQLDQLATGLIDAANSATNAGTAYPAPNSLTSAASVSATDSFSATGSVRIAVTSSTGSVVSTTDLDLSSYSTVQDLLTGLNGISGISASISSSGQLVIQSSNSSDGVAINGLTSSVGASDQSFSSYFGFNDLFTGDDASTIAVSSTLTNDSTALATATLSSASGLASGSTGVSASDTSVLTALTKALDTSVSLPATGSAAAQTVSLASAASTFVSNAASVISNASTTASTNNSTYTAAQSSLSNATGISVDQQTALLTQYQNQYEAIAQLMSVAKSLYSTLITMMGG